MTTTASTASTGTYLLDPERTRLGFVARLARVAKVGGVFQSFDGRAHLDFAEPERSSAEVTIDVSSVNTDNARRDEHLRSSAFFDVANHPRITFRSASVHRLDGDRFEVVGELTIKGHTASVTIDFRYNGATTDAGGSTRTCFQGQVVVDRTEWGLTWGRMLISDDVVLELEVAAVMTDASG